LTIVIRALLVALFLTSVTLLLATPVFWARSYWHADSFWFNGHNHARAVISNGGHVKLFFQRVSATAPFTIVADSGHRAQPSSDPRPGVRDSGLETSVYFAGFGYAAGPTPYGHNRVILVPFWSLLLFFAVTTGASLYVLRRSRIRHRRSRNLCVKCAYDLRATSDRCPECGTPVPVAT
jgi:hypothetical protein